MSSLEFVADIRHLISRRYGKELSLTAEISTIRIDKPANQGNNGIFRHNIFLSNGAEWSVVEKISTSAREWYFYNSIYHLDQEKYPPLTPELFGAKEPDRDNYTLFIGCGLRIKPEFSESAAQQIASLITRVGLLPVGELKRHKTSLPNSKYLGDYTKAARDIPDCPELDKSLINKIEESRERIDRIIKSLPSYLHHSDLKWDNMVIHGHDQNEGHLCLIDWGQVSERTEGFDFHNFFTFDAAGNLENPDFLEYMISRYRELSGSQTPVKNLLLSGALARMSWSLGHLRRHRKFKYAERFMSSAHYALKIARS